MSLQDAKRLLQWKVVMEALSAAGVDAETIKVVESARQAGDVVQSMTQMLLGSVDTKQAKNYVKFEMVGLTLPFERVYVELVRPNGKTSHELRGLLRARLMHVHAKLAEGTPSDGLRAGLIEGIASDLAEEAPG
jgi:hypothetical protein